MNTASLKRKEAFVARVDIDPEWKVVGQHPATHATVYEEQRPYFTNVPDLDAQGKQVWEPHPLNASPSYRRRRVETELRPFRFTLFDDTNGNVRKDEYVEPTAAELRERDIAGRKHDLLAGLVHEMAERNITPGSLLDAVFAPEEPEPYPRKAPGVGRWLLSDGSKMQGSQADAETAEAALHASM